LQRQRQTDISETNNGYLHIRWFSCIWMNNAVSDLVFLISQADFF
jgi:hypothetical protein